MPVVNFDSVTLITPRGDSVSQPGDSVIENEVRNLFEACRGVDTVLLLECVWRDDSGKTILSLDGFGNGLITEVSEVSNEQKYTYSHPEQATEAWLNFLRAHRTV